ncbi:MAG: hypothetical protein ACLFTV_09175, partial [Desulfococcaceae bacterium]
LKNDIKSIGRTTVVGEDDIWIFDCASSKRLGLRDWTIPLVVGESVRDWNISEPPTAVYPYESMGGIPVSRIPSWFLNTFGFFEISWKFEPFLAKL